MSSKIQSNRDVYAAIAVAFIWMLSVLDEAHAEAWVPVDHARLDAVFVEQSASLQHYHSVMMDPLSVWFGESNNAMDAEPDAYLAAFRAAYVAAFTESLPDQGLKLVDEPAPGVLRLHVEIVDLMVNEYTAEQLMWAERFRFPTAPGFLTLVAELSDASTGAVLVRVADLGVSSEGHEVWESVRRSFEAWASTLASVLVDHDQAPALASR